MHAIMHLQGYLAHKKTHFPRTLTKAYASGPRGFLGGGGVFLWARYPCTTLSTFQGKEPGLVKPVRPNQESDRAYMGTSLIRKVHLSRTTVGPLGIVLL